MFLNKQIYLFIYLYIILRINKFWFVDFIGYLILISSLLIIIRILGLCNIYIKLWINYSLILRNLGLPILFKINNKKRDKIYIYIDHNRYNMHFKNKSIFFIKYLNISDILKKKFSKIYSVKTTIRKFQYYIYNI